MELEAYLGIEEDSTTGKSSLSLNRKMSKLAEPPRRGNFLLRQELSDYTPHYSIKCAIVFNLLLALIFLIFTTPFQNTTKAYLEFRYDNW